MPRTGWPGLPKFPALPEWPWQHADAARPDEPRAPRGLVIAGGGARASFEIGALTYLYDETDFHPEVITGTSAGSILTCALAQSADRDEQRRVLQGLEDVWRSLRSADEMFAPRDWFTRMMQVAPDLTAVFEASGVDSEPEHEARPRVRFQLPALRRRPTREDVDAEESKEPGPDEHFHPLLGFGPESDELGEGASWNAQAVGQAMGVLQALGRAGGDIPQILHGAERTRAMYRPGRILRSLLEPSFFSPARVAASGVDIRIAMVCLENGQLRYLRADGTMVDRDDREVPDEPAVDLVMGLLASCSIPGVFAPVPINGKHYVDGGVRENLPVEACIGHLGAERPVVLVCSPPGLAPDQAAGESNLFGIFGRTAAILSDECLRDEVAYARTIGARVIEPEIDVHGAMVVDPGLIDINIAYGWMRAHEVMTDADEATIRLHRDVVMARQRCWALENELYAPVVEGQAPNADADSDLVELVEQKYRVRDLVADHADLFPAGAERWWLGFEAHPYRIALRPPWLPLEPPRLPGS